MSKWFLNFVNFNSTDYDAVIWFFFIFTIYLGCVLEKQDKSAEEQNLDENSVEEENTSTGNVSSKNSSRKTANVIIIYLLFILKFSIMFNI